MNLSECCGAATKVEYRHDHPYIYDDAYHLQIPVLICTGCGKVVGLHSNKLSSGEEK